jgi:hypothetical protein
MLRGAAFALILAFLGVSAAGQVPDDPSYLVHSVRTTISALENDQPMERRCVTIYEDGSFRSELVRQFIDTPQNADFWVYKDSLTTEQIQQLKSHLESKSLIEAPNRESREGLLFQEGEFTMLYIRRPEKVQVLELKSVFGSRRRDPFNTGRPTLIDSIGDPNKIDDKAAAAPLLKWMKENIEKRKLKSLKGEPAKCVPPSGSTAKLKKPPMSK